ncbi:MAG: S41 family peptidase [Candidatus Pacebacteria bacterium]|nr:S41 family peptidase [Candidatus Paceibacterota bacterium]
MKNKVIKKSFLFITLIVIVAISFRAGFYFGLQETPKPPEDLPPGVDLSVLWEVWRAIEEKYIGKIDYQEMIYGGAKGIAQSVNDPYTVFYTPEESEMFLEDIFGSFEGVGMEIGIRDGYLTVVAPLEGTPAKKAGILAGDRIIKIEDIYTKDLTIYEAVKMIRGPKGTKVRLTIMREGWEEPKEIEIVRDVINIPSIKVEILEKNIAHLTIYQFNENTVLQFKKAVQFIKEKGAKKIILDLRNNPGGLLDKVQEIAGWFLEQNKIIAIARYANGEEDIYKAKGPSTLLNYPLVILVNKGTASGAEIFAAALREQRDDVKLIGERTFGKGSVQETVNIGKIKREGMLKVTTAHWFTPKNQLINKKGLEPDIEVELTQEDIEKGKDPQLDKAKEVIKNL